MPLAPVKRAELIISASTEGVPPYQVIPYITRGYRVNHSGLSALQSWLTMHMDTINIWTHFIGTLYFLWGYTHVWEVLNRTGATLSEYVVFFFYVTCALFQMASSTLYHTVRCISPEHDSIYLRLDVGGIALMIIGSYSVGLHQGFYCEPTYAYAYMGGLLAILSVCAVMMVQPGFQTSAWDFARSASLSSAVCFGLIPAYHWVVHCEWHCLEQVWTAILGMFSCYAIGFVFFFFRIPERWFAGTFDYVGASHQIWHTFVVLAGVFWLHGMVAFHEWRVAHGAHCEPGLGEMPIPFAGT